MNDFIKNGIRAERKKLKKVYFIIIAALLSIIIIIFLLKKYDLLPGFSTQIGQETKQQDEQSERIPVTAYKASRVKYEDSLSVLGNVEGGIQVELNFEKEGKIKNIFYKEGDFVEKGKVIAQLDAQEAALKEEQARIEYEQHKKLYEAGVIIKAKLMQAKNSLDQAKVEFEKTIMRAPFDGIVSSIQQKEGEVINSTKKIISLFDTKKMVINIGVTENDINKLTLEQPANVVFDAIRDKIYQGYVNNIDPNIDPTTRMMTLKVIVDNEEALILPGMFARVKINIFEEDNALVIPSMAIMKQDGENNVFVVSQGNNVAPRSVEISYLSDEFAVVAKGLNEGELIVLDKLDRMKEEAMVEILNVEEYTTHTPGKSSE
ncbi:MAG: efflux RND transporter periplasmic adaptor subunit [bacterium]